jgi:hypothetical protein
MSCTDLTLTHLRGQMVRASVTFQAYVDDVLTNVDPAQVRAMVKHPVDSPDVTEYEYGVTADIVRDDTGEYHLDIDADAAGTWYVRFEGEGSYQGASEGSFIVVPGQFA